MDKNDAAKDNGTTITTSCSPFEWLTGSPSVVPLVESALSQLHHKDEGVRILHVGSGSSILGEHLVETMGDRIELVVNVDKDVETLQSMQARWNKSRSTSRPELLPKLQFVSADFDATSNSNNDNINDLMVPYPEGYFDIAIDKSTLDCTLCSDSATAGLLTEVYRLLKPSGGTYMVISFHHLDMLQPLFQDLPGADWHVSHSVMQRQVEDLITPQNSKNKGGTTTLQSTSSDIHHSQEQQSTSNLENSSKPDKSEGAWASGSFEPDEQYRRTVNVLMCRRQDSNATNSTSCLDRTAVMDHVHATNDRWFQLHNPMLTSQRRETIRDLFLEETATNNNNDDREGSNAASMMCSLEVAYKILFTEAEREHLTYDLFLEDWEAWVAEKNDVDFSQDEMSLESALEFLEAMQ